MQVQRLLRARTNNHIPGRKIDSGVLVIFFCLVCCAGVLAGDKTPGLEFSVTGRGMTWADTVTLDLSDVMPWARRLNALDPNFPEDGKQVFTGVKLTRVLELAGLDNDHSLTVIGSDQYVGYLTPARVARGMLVWEAEGRPVSKFRGGPLKLMFPGGAGVHSSCYTWYVTALVQGSPGAPDLTVTVRDNQHKYSISDLVAKSEPLPAHLVSIAQGCRNAFAPRDLDQPARSVSLTRLTGDLSRAGSLELVPYYGPVVRLKPEALAVDARIIVRYGDQDLHPALGGPYTVVFPVEARPELKGLVPESGAFFFLKTIKVR